jgi:hypothetical protein
MGVLWKKFVDADGSHHWPMGPFFTWNLVGVICFLAFVWSCWIRTPTPAGCDEIVGAAGDDPTL